MNKTVAFLSAAIVAAGAVVVAIWQAGRVGEESRLKTEAIIAWKKTEGTLTTTQAQLTQLRQQKEAAEAAAKAEIDQLRKERQALDAAAASAREQVKQLETAKVIAEQGKAAAEVAHSKERAAREAAERALAEAKKQ
jgi:hypothetical protein